jgi:Fe-S-cluster containining protein
MFGLGTARPPFERSVCGCEPCTAPCRTAPGHLLPSDVARLAGELVAMGWIEKAEDVGTYLRASPGAVVGKQLGGGVLRMYRIGTIVPARRHDKRCVFLTDEERCAIHTVAPFGCAYFTLHESMAQGHEKSAWGLDVIVRDGAYAALRETLLPNDRRMPR